MMKIGITRLYLIGLVVALAATAAAALLPLGREKGGVRSEVAVFRPNLDNRLSNANLVDAMVGLELSGKLARVEWSHAILTVEMKLDEDQGLEPVKRDLEKLVRLSFVKLDNVNRLLIRFVDVGDGNAGQGRLLLASDVRKGDGWLLTELGGLGTADSLHDIRWRERLRISFTSAWTEKFGPLSSYSTAPL
ncbi:hypothetical protein [Paenibacillus sp. NPDC058071]|uniref:hypothetical protein n=1 Tax=Paenibacillus sp. NPDC058071 TaxID=3346326 RepID=UPI0036D9C264